MKLNSLIIGSSLVLAACASAPVGIGDFETRTVDAAEFDEFIENERLRSRANRNRVRYLTAEEIYSGFFESIGNKTRVIANDGHGIYLEYTSPTGEFSMWYPGDETPVMGTWEIDESYNPARVCFQFLNASHHLTGEYEPRICVGTHSTLFDGYIMDKTEGDVFDLMSGELPFVKEPFDYPGWPQ